MRKNKTQMTFNNNKIMKVLKFVTLKKEKTRQKHTPQCQCRQEQNLQYQYNKYTLSM